MKTMKPINFCIAMAALGLTQAADAAVVTRTFDVVGKNFTPFAGQTGVPAVDTVKLNFTITFDTDVEQTDPTDSFTVNSFNLPYALKWTYAGSVLTIGTFVSPAGCRTDPSSFCTFIFSPGNAQPTVNFISQTNSDGTFFFANERKVSFVEGAAVPEPATWAMMLAGFGLAGAALRRRTKAAVAYA